MGVGLLRKVNALFYDIFVPNHFISFTTPTSEGHLKMGMVVWNLFYARPDTDDGLKNVVHIRRYQRYVIDMVKYVIFAHY